jgi:DUF438 domain-containing protein
MAGTLDVVPGRGRADGPRICSIIARDTGGLSMEKAEQLTHLLKRLNAGENPEAVKAEARELLATIDPQDLALAEQTLIDEGLSVEDLQGLCPIHLEMLDEQVGFIASTLREHIFKENNILYPMALQVVADEGVWQRLKTECDAIGYCCFTPQA